MSFREQKQLFEDLRNLEYKFEYKDKEDYKMFLKRHKDDEYLDTISMTKLKKIHEKYFVNRPKPDLNSLFKNEVKD